MRYPKICSSRSPAPSCVRDRGAHYQRHVRHHPQRAAGPTVAMDSIAPQRLNGHICAGRERREAQYTAPGSRPQQRTAQRDASCPRWTSTSTSSRPHKERHAAAQRHQRLDKPISLQLMGISGAKPMVAMFRPPADDHGAPGIICRPAGARPKTAPSPSGWSGRSQSHLARDSASIKSPARPDRGSGRRPNRRRFLADGVASATRDPVRATTSWR